MAPLPGWLEFAGAAVVATGFVVRQYAIAVLGEFFTLNVAIRDQHPLVTAGPYQIVRHPGYSGVILICFGFGLSLCDGFAFVGVVCADHLRVALPNLTRRASSAVVDSRIPRVLRANLRLCPYICRCSMAIVCHRSSMNALDLWSQAKARCVGV